MLIDSYGRTIDYLRISVTDRCNLRCRYCIPSCGIARRPRQELLSFEEILNIAEAASEAGIKNIRLTGGEPLIRKGLAGLISSLSGIEGIENISMTTNGIFLKDHAAALKSAGLKRLNISLDSLRHERYRWITREGNLRDVLDGIDNAFDAGFSLIKINVLLLDEMTVREIPDFLRLGLEKGVHVRFLEFMPIGPFYPSTGSGLPRASPAKGGARRGGYKYRNFIPAEKVLEIAGRLGGVEEAANYGHGPAKVYRLKRSLGTFGIISPISDKFCAACNRLRLTSDGFLKSCLCSEIKVDLRGPLRNGAGKEELIRLIRSAVRMKPEEHFIDVPAAKPLEYSMCQIGG